MKMRSIAILMLATMAFNINARDTGNNSFAGEGICSGAFGNNILEERIEEIPRALENEQVETDTKPVLRVLSCVQTTVEDRVDVMYIEGEDGTLYQVVETLEILATGYCHCAECCDKEPGEPGYGITASGKNVLAMIERGIIPKIVAADTRVLPFGTKIYIEVPDGSRDTRYVTEDFGIASVEDRGGAIKGKRIDVYFKTHQEALEWGRRNVLVHVLVPVGNK